jgi:hypothetical protein
MFSAAPPAPSSLWRRGGLRERGGDLAAGAEGQVRHRIPLGSPLPHIPSPSLSGQLVLVGALHGVVAVSGA